ncbi:SDR family NAD(P)-dependent oxidoreductase [Sulfitobacter guttiformis]|uniref:NADP-dependent 3-hydroxy acid dehydrogenase YdfG n=1 Tax=Sulfitobacter guttiformis TaxID=74349 RepID=A0A420DP49_9RHOB|nr:SDR family NAD(P)-dependent oxidoreductase [Sulfitobacter guttiformis]KIN73356.1 Oxidoreductase, short-chain dehydrogenase/reductase family [Sulfitobacter guttiformis KCTC 32187]RKE96022.1 NADP-dependent 3-hydroxy acid dehydrogenase YdfG [Sulfitobacter guttiformis]
MTVVITGASRGIGAGLAAHYRAAGFDVTGTSRSPMGDISLDVTHPSSHKDMAAALGDSAVELLVCNAGVYLDKGNDIETGYGADLWAQSFATNVTGVFLAVQALLPHLRRAENPRIAIISSQMASSELAPGGSYIYRASKAAVLNLGRNLATDLKAEGIAVGIYHPGWVQTDMGGDTAAITVDEAVTGLASRFEALDIGTTGCFETWDGRAHPY